ncbi:hypothetical protein O6H91_07G107100 [Diphasiastrum complanatum]|uniref:Uncharacterized protein n=2 Tax=Diphasiastrum complanatum TaxID=34168 RepID=A0ACC2D8E0_DIPCM|nr:hypothetical protein O6H91_07G107100 [Diphasiastrum complanatum]KAJ7550577.1 hypothetical protein O6H91_07G107100 [Diphasiastrum complanatum]
MISGEDLYKVLSAVVPLYAAMILAYGSVRWWKILTPEQCEGINRFVAIFAVPFLSFHIIASNNPYTMNAKFIAADTIQKIALLIMLGLWARYSNNGSLEWMITLFMLATLPNTLVMGIPLLTAMYGADFGNIAVQAVVLQCIIWYTLLLFLYEFRSAKLLISEQFPKTAASIVSFKVESDVMSLDVREALETEAEVKDNGKIHVTVRRSTSSQSHQLLSPRRSLGVASMPSSKAITPRLSNLTGAEIYSIQSSRNLTPRESSFTYKEFNPIDIIRPVPGSPRHSNFTASDVYSLQSSGGPTPRTSNFTEESPKGLHTLEKVVNVDSPLLPIRSSSSSATGVQTHVSRPHGSGSEPVNVSHRSIPVGRRSCPDGMESPNHPSQTTRKSTDPRALAKLDDLSKEFHMFLWSSDGSPVPVGAQAFGAATDVSRQENEMKIIFGLPGQPAANLVDRFQSGENCKEIEHDDFSFGNRASFGGDEYHSADKDGPSLTKLSSSSTAELAPKTPKMKMPPTTVISKLIFSMVWRKLVRNPNTYSSLLGIIWALISFRLHAKMPAILENSIAIISNAGLGMAMFSLGLFMALQKRLLVCGTTLALSGMVLRFLTGPAVMAASSIGVGMRGVSLQVSIVQAALPQGIVPFVFAKEYNVHADVISTAVILGMLVALPIDLVYYILLGL